MIYNGMIPLSLSINMATVRGLQWFEFFVSGMKKLPYRSSNFPGIEANNTSLTGDLCNIQYIMSDKTGTLTKNEMVFQYLADAAGKIYKVRCHRVSSSHIQVDSSEEYLREEVNSDLLRCLGLCTTVSPP